MGVFLPPISIPANSIYRSSRRITWNLSCKLSGGLTLRSPRIGGHRSSSIHYRRLFRAIRSCLIPKDPGRVCRKPMCPHQRFRSFCFRAIARFRLDPILVRPSRLRRIPPRRSIRPPPLLPRTSLARWGADTIVPKEFPSPLSSTAYSRVGMASPWAHPEIALRRPVV